MESSTNRPAPRPSAIAVADLTRRGILLPPEHDRDALETATNEGPATTLVSEMLALQRGGDTARGG
ncbi:MAG TPA: hypothetical protein VHX88_15565 [Solirubrobacteraceae bacterium]|jgi:hypothetical protein|nr:hypothetical protein [Solirubrobacteraceae bacterium]